MFVMGGVLCFVRMFCDNFWDSRSRRKKPTEQNTMYYLICGQQEVHWMKHSFWYGFSNDQELPHRFCCNAKFHCKKFEKFSAVFPEVTLQPWVILESIRLLSNVGNKIAKSCFKQWVRMARAYCSFCRITHLGPGQTWCFCCAELNSNLVRL